jgi:hypothetical protein
MDVDAGAGPGPLGYAAVGLAWLVPGAGHLAIGQRGRGLVFLITIHLLFLSGLLLGGIHAMNPPEQPIWSYTQLLAGWPTLAANALARNEDTNAKDFGADPGVYAPKIQDVGTVYCGLAGMLNLLLIFDVLVRVTSPAKDEAKP